MRRLVHFFAKLYPSRWRTRYGREFEALLEDTSPSAKTALNVFTGALSMQIRTWNVGRILAIAGLAGLTIAGGIALTLPKRYVSTAVLTVAQAPISRDVQDAINTMANNTLSRESLTRIVNSLDLYPRERVKAPLEDVTDRLRNRIHIVPISSGSLMPGKSAFAIQFEHPDPVLARKVTIALADRFIDENIRQRSDAFRAAQQAGKEVPGDLMVQVRDIASLPRQPSFPNTPAIAIAGLAGGLALGGALVFLLRRTRLHAA